MTDNIRPLDPARREAQALLNALGVDGQNLNPRDRAALEALSEEVIALRGEVDALTGALSNAELLADNDALCPLFNRRAFHREVRREIAIADRFGSPLSLIFIDLDNFKNVNDVFGHSVGDDVLVGVSEVLLSHTRETDIVGRLGGDEFGILLAHTEHASARQKAEQLAAAMDALTVSTDQDAHSASVPLGGSCGVTQWQTGQGADTLIARADQAMYLEKSRRKTAAAPKHQDAATTSY